MDTIHVHNCTFELMYYEHTIYGNPFVLLIPALYSHQNKPKYEQWFMVNEYYYNHLQSIKRSYSCYSCNIKKNTIIEICII